MNNRNILRLIFAKNNLLDEYRSQKPIFIWTEVSGELGKIARPRQVKGNKLILDVPSAAAKQELTYLETELLDRLNEHLKEKKIKKLKFQIGEFPDQSRTPTRKFDISEVSLTEEEMEDIDSAVSGRGLEGETKESLRSLLISQQKNRKVRLNAGWTECPNCGGVYDGKNCPYCGLPSGPS